MMHQLLKMQILGCQWENGGTDVAKNASDMILAEAIDNNYGVAGDDITVIVAKIIKRK